MGFWGNMPKLKDQTLVQWKKRLPLISQISSVSVLFVKAHVGVLRTKVHAVSTMFSLAFITEIRPVLLSLYTSSKA